MNPMPVTTNSPEPTEAQRIYVWAGLPKHEADKLMLALQFTFDVYASYKEEGTYQRDLHSASEPAYSVYYASAEYQKSTHRDVPYKLRNQIIEFVRGAMAIIELERGA